MTNLENLVAGYIEAMLWTECLDGQFDLVTDTVAKEIASECKAFFDANENDIDEFAGIYSYRMTGHMFWLTRNGHGTGFWDQDMGDLGGKLTKASDAFPPAYLYEGDDGVYHYFAG